MNGIFMAIENAVMFLFAVTPFSDPDEIVPVEVPQRRGDTIIVTEDEEYKNVKMEKIPTLRPVFNKEGTITAANASTLNDGASALLIMSSDKAEELNIMPIAKIKSYADAAQDPEWFTTAPAKAVPFIPRISTGIEGNASSKFFPS